MNKFISPKAICIFKNKSKILVSKGYDKVKKDFYYRSPGGRVEFRETSEETIRREIMEEFNQKIVNLRYLGVIESIFTLDGENYHEIVFIYEADFNNKEIYEKQKVEMFEAGWHEAQWIEYDEFKNNGLRLVPEDIKKFIEI
ncbi:MAG: NUDIX domain-containing protein [Chlorobi bacterium]|nr:NUDIX domain-containing protein [Chlorobiota bacterium]MCI0716263.1 NUDIX domain-containing protein [Chlorobiota bacterium]